MASLPEPQTFTEALALIEISSNEWETIRNPQRMGNAANIAYGGFALAVAASAGYKSVPLGYHLYTMMGMYLGPALTDRPLRATTQTVRQTRTFATRQVQVSQRQDDGSFRPCLVALVDFQVPEKASLLTYSAPPSKKYSHHSKLRSGQEQHQKLADQGKVPQAVVDVFSKSFGVMSSLYETRPCPEGIFAQNLNGMAKHLPTTQDSLPLTGRSTADWGRSLTPLPTPLDNLSALAFLLDGAVSFSPLTFNHMFLDDSAACSSLDFALRVFSNAVDLEKWHLREIQTHVGAEGRTYSEARIWDEEGKCIGCMTQQSIMRPIVKEAKL